MAKMEKTDSEQLEIVISGAEEENGEGENEETDELVPKRGAHSVVWRRPTIPARRFGQGGSLRQKKQTLDRHNQRDHSPPRERHDRAEYGGKRRLQADGQDAGSQTSYFPDDHTGELLAAGLQEVLDSWGLPENKLVAITTDDGEDVKKAVEINKWAGLQCFGHKLHLAIEKGLSDERIQEAIGMCKKIVSTFSSSSKKRKDLAIVQNYLGLPNHVLTVETPTRWGSRQVMIQRVLEQERAISHVLKEDKKSRHLLPSWQDLEVLEAVNKALCPLQDFTDALSGEQYVGVSYLKPVLKLFNASILAEDENDPQLTKDVKRNVLADLNGKYSHPVVDDLLDMASLLDPRFRTKYTDEEKVERVLSRAVEEIVSLTKPQQDPLPGAAASGAESEPDPPPKPKRRKTLASFFKSQGGAVTEEESVREELTVYLQAADVDSDVNPFDWWRCRQTSFPRVAKLARRYLCIPATSAPSERAFSADGNLVPCHRAALKPDAVDRLVFLAQNL
ncbi:E3 SUMO-protein ligase ZBED1-like isoform X4 [Vanacampus margaritifer]